MGPLWSCLHTRQEKNGPKTVLPPHPVAAKGGTLSFSCEFRGGPERLSLCFLLPPSTQSSWLSIEFLWVLPIARCIQGAPAPCCIQGVPRTRPALIADENVPTAVRFGPCGGPGLWDPLQAGFRNRSWAHAPGSSSMLAARRADTPALSPILEFLGGEWYVSGTGSGEEPQRETSRLGVLGSFDLRAIVI